MGERSMGLYVYAVTSIEDDLPSLQGVLDRQTFRVGSGPLNAIVSECPHGSLRAERRNLAAAQRVLTALNAKFDLLPMAFGTIAKSESDLRQFLDGQRDRLVNQLQRISGAVEMGVRLNIDAADPIAYLVARHPALQAARDRTYVGSRPPSHDAKVRLGQMVDEAFRRYREAQSAQVMSVLGDACIEVLSLPVRNEKEIANLAALVPRAGLEEFERAVQASANEIEEEIAFNIAGPWPPHNFVQFASQEG
ncbi:GvpL/GvpF family gas vesicle protein [Methylocystis sp. MJC1]|uniref:GvpL/GvpF family gas vesicle protein n=1 Tax=Methylocystis sp. MJC1 TaxID=2654282 RepID=UPI0013EB24FF|nr:GvpL/GvpF family gas vesicle protein [Methylocystis sp. MJC1]MBU6527619.1 GvpL/GvpF family gas vesicle protein [Methylocystis sp. MJC1]UZX10560.1 GvpL/GvpF family gas vesicle protein [Methylocystis sp. MJC1]